MPFILISRNIVYNPIHHIREPAEKIMSTTLLCQIYQLPPFLRQLSIILTTYSFINYIKRAGDSVISNTNFYLGPLLLIYHSLPLLTELQVSGKQEIFPECSMPCLTCRSCFCRTLAYLRENISLGSILKRRHV